MHGFLTHERLPPVGNSKAETTVFPLSRQRSCWSPLPTEQTVRYQRLQRASPSAAAQRRPVITSSYRRGATSRNTTTSDRRASAPHAATAMAGTHEGGADSCRGCNGQNGCNANSACGAEDRWTTSHRQCASRRRQHPLVYQLTPCGRAGSAGRDPESGCQCPERRSRDLRYNASRSCLGK